MIFNKDSCMSEVNKNRLKDVSNMDWKINDFEYFERCNNSLLIFNNFYPEGKQGGIELVQHGERILANGDLRIVEISNQWSSTPSTIKKNIDRENKSIKLCQKYEKEDIDYSINIRAEKESVIIDVCVDNLPVDYLNNKLGFNFEFFPDSFCGKTYFMDNKPGILPRLESGEISKGSDKDFLSLIPLASGKKLIVAPEDELKSFVVESDNTTLDLIDVRKKETHGLFVVRANIPENNDKNNFTIRLTPTSIPNWRKKPIVLYSQIGYHPCQDKVCLIEYDLKEELSTDITLYKLDEKGKLHPVLKKEIKNWGLFLNNNYGRFDFSEIKEEGLYLIGFNNIKTEMFRIHKEIYNRGVWQPTLETYIPVQMCHMEVSDRNRIWHGLCHQNDAYQAPSNLDLSYVEEYEQGKLLDTTFKENEKIPNLNIGGWHDAGDFDLAATSQTWVTHILSLIYEEFGIQSDQTSIDFVNKRVKLKCPDGSPDILEQIVHGVENLLGGYRNSDHSFIGISDPSIDQYKKTGDAASVLDSSNDMNTVEGHSTGFRYAFTNRDTSVEYMNCSALATASKAIVDFNNQLSKECLSTAQKIWEYENNNQPIYSPGPEISEDFFYSQVLASVELYLVTKDEIYLDFIENNISAITKNIDKVGWAVARVANEIKNINIINEYENALNNYSKLLSDSLEKNPFRVPLEMYIWGVGWKVQDFAVKQYFLHKYYPNLFFADNVYRSLHYVLGCHPCSNTSLVSGVGVKSMLIAYGTNVDDYTFIPGGVVSGPALLHPNIVEFREEYPYLWQQAEYSIIGAATYLFTVFAVKKLTNNQ